KESKILQIINEFELPEINSICALWHTNREISIGSNHPYFSSNLVRIGWDDKLFVDGAFIVLAKICPNLLSVSINPQSGVTDEFVKILDKNCPGLKKVVIHDKQVKDIGIKALAEKCPRLKEVEPPGTITDKGLKFLAEKCPALEKVWIYGRNVTDAGVTT